MFSLVCTIIISVFTIETTFGQISFYQDIFYGGVTGNGYNQWFSEYPGNIDINIEPGSTIRKAFLFFSIYRNPTDKQILFNGNSIQLSSEQAVNDSVYLEVGGTNIYLKTAVIDVTSFVSPSVNSYLITPPVVSNDLNGNFNEFYLLVLYDNPLLSRTSVSVFLNDKNFEPYNSYNFQGLNPMDTTKNIGLILQTDNICDTLHDGSFVFIDGNQIGLIGGTEYNSFTNCGVTGSFFYQNNQLYGLGNDTPDNTMQGSDAISNIESFVSNNSGFNLGFVYQNSNINEGNNCFNQFFVVYSSPCDTIGITTISDTSICNGDSIQLHVIGGQSYKWLPSIGLSCSTCPNPIFTGDSTTNYTVQIWNNDSCSVIRPIRINVKPKPIFGNISKSPSICGIDNGKVILSASNGTVLPVVFSINGSVQNSGTFSNLSAGEHNFIILDGNGCSTDTTINIIETNPTIAQFSVDPTTGTAPMTVVFSNTSTEASNFNWYINGVDQGNTLTSFVCDSSGNYFIQLIAWQYDPSCADTANQNIEIIEKLVIPTAFTPSNDGINDTWDLPNIDKIYPDNIVRIYNRWGELLFESKKGKYFQNEWDGTYNSSKLPIGTYYFIIDTNNKNKEVFNGIVTIIR